MSPGCAQWVLRAIGIADYLPGVPEHADRALSELCVAVGRAQERLDRVLTRAAFLREQRAQGQTYAEIVQREERPLVVELLTEVLEELAGAGAAFRRAEARVLYREGLSQEAIGALFGVTRQRVSVLLHESHS